MLQPRSVAKAFQGAPLKAVAKTWRNSVMSFVYVFTILSWVWFFAHCFVIFAQEVRTNRELRVEALLLLEGVCSLPRSYPISGKLIRCDEARDIASARYVVVTAVERTAARLMKDLVWTVREEASITMRSLGVLGMVGALAIAVGRFWVYRKSCRYMCDPWSDMYVHKNQHLVNMPRMYRLEDIKEE